MPFVCFGFDFFRIVHLEGPTGNIEFVGGIVAGFGCGSTKLDPLYVSGVVIGTYALDGGKFILNALNVLANIDRHPAADRLLLNLVRHARKLAGETRKTSRAKPAAEKVSGPALLPGQAQI